MNRNNFPDQGLAGSYVAYRALSSKQLTIRNNGTFKAVYASCTWSLIVSGTWYISSDTLITCPNKIYTSQDKDTGFYDYRQAPENYLIHEGKLLHLTWKQIDHGEPFPYVDTLCKLVVLNNRGKLKHINSKKKAGK